MLMLIKHLKNSLTRLGSRCSYYIFNYKYFSSLCISVQLFSIPTSKTMSSKKLKHKQIRYRMLKPQCISVYLKTLMYPRAPSRCINLRTYTYEANKPQLNLPNFTILKWRLVSAVLPGQSHPAQTRKRFWSKIVSGMKRVIDRQLSAFYLRPKTLLIGKPMASELPFWIQLNSIA